MKKKRDISGQAVEFILTRRIEEFKNLTVKYIARNIGINRFYLSFRFIINQKISLSNFIMRGKIHEAYFILEEDKEIPLEELSRLLGFLKFEDFSTEFEKYFAITPDRYRNLSRNPGILR